MYWQVVWNYSNSNKHKPLKLLPFYWYYKHKQKLIQPKSLLMADKNTQLQLQSKNPDTIP